MFPLDLSRFPEISPVANLFVMQDNKPTSISSRMEINFARRVGACRPQLYGVNCAISVYFVEALCAIDCAGSKFKCQ